MKYPDFAKPVDIHAFFYNEFGACGCSDLPAMIGVVKSLLEWLSSNIVERPSYDTLFGGNTGVFYILVGRLDSLGFSEHGSSIRCAWLTDTGEDFLKALRGVSVDAIENCQYEEAYDGAWYGVIEP